MKIPRLGRLAYLFFHKPKTWLETTVDGALLGRRDARMRECATKLSRLSLPEWGLKLPPIKFLTGKRFAHQSAYCAYSFSWVCKTQLRFEFFDDGSLRDSDTANLLRLFPFAKIISAAEREANLEVRFPRERFPVLREMRSFSPMMFKLLDLRSANSGPNLYLDSDMLFFSKPERILEWLSDPKGSLFMNERGNGYVDTPERLEQRFCHSILRGMNAGVIAIDDAEIDWDDLENTAAKFTPAEIRHPWAEQTLTAYLLARHDPHPLPMDAYRLCSNRADVKGSPPILRHYVFKAKMPYLQQEWRNCETLIHSGKSL